MQPKQEALVALGTLPSCSRLPTALAFAEVNARLAGIESNKAETIKSDVLRLAALRSAHQRTQE